MKSIKDIISILFNEDDACYRNDKFEECTCDCQFPCEFCVTKAIEAAIAEEQNRCARLADEYTDGQASKCCASVAHGISAAIRK